MKCLQCKKRVWFWQRKFDAGPIPGSHRDCGIRATIQHTFAFWQGSMPIENIKAVCKMYLPKADHDAIDGA